MAKGDSYYFVGEEARLSNILKMVPKGFQKVSKRENR